MCLASLNDWVLPLEKTDCSMSWTALQLMRSIRRAPDLMRLRSGSSNTYGRMAQIHTLKRGSLMQRPDTGCYEEGMCSILLCRRLTFFQPTLLCSNSKPFQALFQKSRAESRLLLVEELEARVA